MHWENPEYKESAEPPCTGVQYNDADWMEAEDRVWDAPPDRDYVFVKRKWKIKRKKRAKKTEPQPVIATKVSSKNCSKLLGPLVRDWWRWKKTQVSRRQRKHVWHIHDNARYWTAKKTRAWFEKKGVPNYPPGNVYGHHYGFPPHSPDLNCIAEYAVGYVKREVAKKLSVLPLSERLSFTQRQLGKLVEDAAASITSEMITAWRATLNKHVEECIEYGGKYGPSVRGVRKNKNVRAV